MKSNYDPDSWGPSDDLNDRIRECEDMMTQYWNENPDLLEAVNEKKATAKIIADLWKGLPEEPAPLLFPKIETAAPQDAKPPQTNRTLSALNRLNQLKQSPMLQWHWVEELKNKIAANQKIIHENVIVNHGEIDHRTKAHNRKCTFQSVDEERKYRADLLQDQIRAYFLN